MANARRTPAQRPQSDRSAITARLRQAGGNMHWPPMTNSRDRARCGEPLRQPINPRYITDNKKKFEKPAGSFYSPVAYDPFGIERHTDCLRISEDEKNRERFPGNERPARDNPCAEGGLTVRLLRRQCSQYGVRPQARRHTLGIRPERPRQPRPGRTIPRPSDPAVRLHDPRAVGSAYGGHSQYRKGKAG